MVVSDTRAGSVQYGQYVMSLQKQVARKHGWCGAILAVLERINEVVDNIMKILMDRTRVLEQVVQICARGNKMN